jgi:ribosomal protein S6--L-glutamate ligase
MKLAILSREPNSYSTRRLKEAALDRGINVKVLDTLKFAIDLQRGAPDFYFK